MRFLDEDRDVTFSRATIYLTKDEAAQLRDTLIVLLAGHHQHEHVLSEDFEKEITVCIYDPQDLRGFDERSRRLIERDT